MLMGSSQYSDAQNRHVQHKSGSTTLASVMDYPTDSSTAADLSSVTCNSAYTYDCNPNQYSSHWRHVWPEAVDWDSQGGNHLNMFYTEEVPTCPVNSQGEFVTSGNGVSCTSPSECQLASNFDDVPEWRDCYQKQCMGMRRPRVGVARSWDNGQTWTDVGVIVYNGVSPTDDDCRHTKVYNMSGGVGDEGIATEMSPTNGHKYYYIFGSNYHGGDATNKINHGIVVARIKAADIGNPSASAYFYNSTTSQWNIRIPNALEGTLAPSSAINDGAGHYFSHLDMGWTTDSASIPAFAPENSWKS